ncbi:MAG: terminase family protein [Bacteroidales bacterium]|jgi:phage FluMu gp28-like protein|nr:terminase family protein [Bacteroidales bacterium]
MRKRISKNIDYAKFGFLPYQVRWLEDESKIKIYEKSRRIGITYAQSFEDVIDAGVYGMYDVWFSSNNDLNAREYIRYCKSYASTLDLIIKDVTGETVTEDAKTYCIEFKNGCRITAVSSSPEQLHGKGGKMVLDEFARREDEAETWEAASPAALIWDYPIRIISTHKGKNSMFYAFLKKVRKGLVRWSHHKTTFTEAVAQGLADKVKDRALNDTERQEYIDTVKEEVADDTIWDQQFMCEAADESETFIPYALLEANASTELLAFCDLKDCKTLYAGLDIGRFKNLSLLWVIEQVSSVHYITRFIRPIEGTDFPRQEEIINPFASLPNMRRICIDQTGMGIGLTDYLQLRHGKSKIEGVTFTGPVKESMAFRVKKWLEDHIFNVPDDQTIHDDFHSVKKEVTTAGNIRLKADTNNKTNSHADWFWGAALACEAASSKPYNKPKVTTRKAKLKGRLNKLLKGFQK